MKPQRTIVQRFWHRRMVSPWFLLTTATCFFFRRDKKYPENQLRLLWITEIQSDFLRCFILGVHLLLVFFRQLSLLILSQAWRSCAGVEMGKWLKAWNHHHWDFQTSLSWKLFHCWVHKGTKICPICVVFQTDTITSTNDEIESELLQDCAALWPAHDNWCLYKIKCLTKYDERWSYFSLLPNVVKYYWCFRNPVNSPVEVGSWSHVLQGIWNYPTGGWPWDHFHQIYWFLRQILWSKVCHHSWRRQGAEIHSCLMYVKKGLYGYLGGGFKHFLIFTPIWGRFPSWLVCSRGLKPPTSYSCSAIVTNNLLTIVSMHHQDFWICLDVHFIMSFLTLLDVRPSPFPNRCIRKPSWRTTKAGHCETDSNDTEAVKKR